MLTQKRLVSSAALLAFFIFNSFQAKAEMKMIGGGAPTGKTCTIAICYCLYDPTTNQPVGPPKFVPAGVAATLTVDNQKFSGKTDATGKLTLTLPFNYSGVTSVESIDVLFLGNKYTESITLLWFDTVSGSVVIYIPNVM